MSDFPRPTRTKNALDNRKLNLSAPTPNHQGKFANLIWGLYANNPRITVYTGDPNDTGEQNGYGAIKANLDAPTFFAFLELINKAIESTSEMKSKIENKNFTFFGGKRSDRPEVVSELWVGREADGRLWLSVTAKNRPKVKFYFIASDFHAFLHGDGTPFTQTETSNIFAKGYVRLLTGLMTTMLNGHWVEPPPKDNSRGGGFGGGNRAGGGGGGGNFSGGGGNRGGAPAQEESDIPF